MRGQFVIEFTKVGSNKHFSVDIPGEAVGQYHGEYTDGDFLLGGTGNNFFRLQGRDEQAAKGLIKPVNGKYHDVAVVVSAGPLPLLFTKDM